MSVLSPTIGDVLDRLSILRLKREVFESRGDEEQLVLVDSEEAALRGFLLEYVDDMASDKLQKLAGMSRTLEAVNKRIWELIDEMRSFEDYEYRKIAKTALAVADSNDVRAKVMAEIDKEFEQVFHIEKTYSRRKTSEA